MPANVSETSLSVEDLEVSAAFYKGVFGLQTILEDERMLALKLPGGGTLLLFRRETEGATPDESGAGHLAFAIPTGSLLDWDRHLMLGGVAIESRVKQPHGGTSLYFRDPDGHSLEVATPGLWPST